MRVVTTYYADDGTPFPNEKDCLEYEAIRKKMNKKNDVVGVMFQLDEDIWKKYYPNWKEKENSPQPTNDNIYLWLRENISFILSDESFDFDTTVAEIREMIEKTGLAPKIFEQIDMDDVIRGAKIRRDFDSALSEAEYGRKLSGPLFWGFSKRDIYRLAKLHKKGKHREKIEDLLEDCNFHYECGRFSSGEYDEFFTDEYTGGVNHE